MIRLMGIIAVGSRGTAMEESPGLDRGLISRWRRIGKRDEKSRFYFEKLRPGVTELLRGRLLARMDDGGLPRYRTLALIVGHDANPALIMANAILPARLLVGFTPKNETQVRKRFLPNLDPAIPREGIRLVELDNMGHGDNFRRILSAIGAIEPRGSALCDVTGGKKIISALMGIAAHELGIDICYIDAEEHEGGMAVPVPGSEALYIHSAAENRVTEIPLIEENRLVISYLEKPGIILYTLNIGNAFFRFEKGNMGPSVITETQRGLSEEFMKAERGIREGRSCEGELREMASLVRTMLMDLSLDARLRSAAPRELRISVDPALSGIPWETALRILYGTGLPMRRAFNRDFETYAAAVPDEKHGVLAVIGSGQGIPGFEEEAAKLRDFFRRWKGRGRVINAESPGALRRELGKRRYNAIAYLGHSVFDGTMEGTGWLCSDGGVFGCDSLLSLAHTPPDLIISSSCRSAAADPFVSHSLAYHAVRAGVRAYVGAAWNLEHEKGLLFLTKMLDSLVAKGHRPFLSFSKGLDALARRYGPDDISLFNYVFYGD